MTIDNIAKSPWRLVLGSALALTVCIGPVIQYSYKVSMVGFAGGLVIACVLITRLGAYRYRPDGTSV